jgi:hypothetical protein
MQNNNAQILEFSFCCSLSIEFISETTRDGGNPLTYMYITGSFAFGWPLLGLFLRKKIP